MRNPFVTHSLLDSPISLDHCQEIYHFAQQEAKRNSRYSNAIQRQNVSLCSRKLVRQDTLFQSVSSLEEIFTGVTSNVFATIRDLYCSRLGRSIDVVYHILEQMAIEAQVRPISYEAVWSICGYLMPRRLESTESRTEHTQTTWYISITKPKLSFKYGQTLISNPALACVFDSQQAIPLTFKFCSETRLRECLGLVLYDALTAIRQPAQLAPTGLVWVLPGQVLGEMLLPHRMERVLAQELGVDFGPVTTPKEFKAVLTNNWESDLSGRLLSYHQLELIFDGYLKHKFDYSPLTEKMNSEYQFRNLIGFTRDPVEQMPSLSQLLPGNESEVSADGSIRFDGLTYDNSLLRYWIGQPVRLHQSPVAESTAWIYVHDDIVCKSMARELRRMDGSYRANRPGRSADVVC